MNNKEKSILRSWLDTNVSESYVKEQFILQTQLTTLLLRLPKYLNESKENTHCDHPT